MGTQIHITVDNTEIIKAAFKAQIKIALEKVGIAAEGYAKQLCPVDTGNLRNSITHKVNGDAVYIGTNVEYGKYVELGTSKMGAQPFLKPAASGHAAEYAQIVKSQLK